jgi:hypothetical protein
MGKKRQRHSGPVEGSSSQPITPVTIEALDAPGEIVLADDRMDTRFLVWSPDGKYLVTLGRWCVIFWETRSWKLEFTLNIDPAWFTTPGSYCLFHFSPDGTRLYDMSDAGVIAWDVPNRRLAWKTARDDRASAVSIDADCKVILCGDGRLIDARTGQWLRPDKPRIPDEHPGGEQFVALSPDGRLIAMLPGDQTNRWMRARDVDTLELVQELAIDPAPPNPARVREMMDEFWASPGTPEYEAEAAKVKAPGYFFGIEMVEHVCNGRFLACYSNDEAIYVIDIGLRPWRVQKVMPCRRVHPMTWSPLIDDAPFSPDRRWVVEPDARGDGTLVVRAFDPVHDKHPCDIL